MGKLAWANARPFYVIAQLRRLVEALESNTGTMMPARTCIPDDMAPECVHVLHGSREGLACLARRDQAIRRDLAALHIACEVAGRAAAQEKARADKFEAALLQEQKRSEEAEAQIQSWMAV